jgi:peptide/nickel transport system ATP-binding protein
MSEPMTDLDRPILETRSLAKRFSIGTRFSAEGRRTVHAVDNVSLTVRRGETVGLVGESGCGKSTLARCLVRLYDITDGKLLFEGDDITSKSLSELRPLRRRLQMVFQDPSASLNPRHTVRDIIGEVLEINARMPRREIDARVEELLVQVGLDPGYAGRYPHAFSGGQRQRIAIARALASTPKLVIADEAVSALDVSVQTQIVNLLKDLQARFGLTYLFISHDLSVVANISDRVAVMYAGRIVEMGETEAIFLRPRHPYTEALLAAVPGQARLEISAPRRVEGQAPRLDGTAVGCSFADRCPYAEDRCRQERPELHVSAGGQQVACHRAEELRLTSPVLAGAD